MLNKFKALIRRTPSLYRPVRILRARQQERKYVHLREFYYSRTKGIFSYPGYLEKSSSLLVQSWQPPHTPKIAPKDVRLFVIVSNDWEHWNLLPDIQKHFDVVTFDYGLLGFFNGDTQSKLVGRTRLQSELLSAFVKAHRQKPIDLVFAYGTYYHFDPDTFKQIRSTGVPTCGMCLDDKHSFLQDPWSRFPSGQKPLIGAFDLHLTSTLECVRWYLGEGVPAFYFPGGCNPDLATLERIPKDIDVSFVGKNYGFRAEFVKELRRSGIAVECFGVGWENGPVSDDEMLRIFMRSRINLGIGGSAFSAKIQERKNRDFDVPATGNLYLTTYDPELARLFHIGREILCYYNEIDCVEQIRYCLERPGEANAIALRGQERCLREYTWAHLMCNLLKWMGILDNVSV